MPSWNDLLNETQALGSTYDSTRRKYLSKLARYTKRNVIAYYSGWLQKGDIVKQPFSGFSVNDSDKNAFMACVHGLDRTKGLDLLLHTPGGDTAATESLVDYLHSMFDKDIRVIIPQISMSAGTMIALASSEIVMGKHSSIGPIDPQIGGLAAHGILEEFDRARKEIAASNAAIPLWQPIIAKYSPTLIGECQKSLALSTDMVRRWLTTVMFHKDEQAPSKAESIVATLLDHALTKTHARHYSAEQAIDMGIVVTKLEDDQRLQDAVLSVHHCMIQTLDATAAFKIVENHQGVAYIQQLQTALVQLQR